MNGNGSMLSMLLPLVLLLVVMYFLLIRPQKKREKEVNAMRSSVQVGDEIITIGGICGKVVKTKEDSLVIQVGADKVKFEIMRWSVSKIVEEGKKHSKNSKPENDDVEETEEIKRAKPKRMKKAAPVETDNDEVVTEEVTPEVVEEAKEENSEAENK